MQWLEFAARDIGGIIAESRDIPVAPSLVEEDQPPSIGEGEPAAIVDPRDEIAVADGTLVSLYPERGLRSRRREEGPIAGLVDIRQAGGPYPQAILAPRLDP